MKKTTLCLMALVLTLMLCVAALAEPMVGGWQNVPQEAAELPEDAQRAFDKATEGEEGVRYTPVALLSTQLVAGMNYCVLCQVSPSETGAENGWALVYIYADLQGGAEITNVYELYIDRHSAPLD